MAWHRQYRPHSIAELDISSVRESLLAMMKAGKIPQALLFAGPKGTGKTSASRIIALLLNDPKNSALVDQVYFAQDAKNKNKSKLKSFVEPDPDSDLAKKVYAGQSFLVHELDAASNRGIDDIRLLKERIALPPQGAKMAVYILDEVHMLTTEAFNALLKVLEEPPAHAVFILATTELHKLPATIVSRCTLLRFRKANDQEIFTALKRVLELEKISFKEKDLLSIAKRADGSFRDAVKTLELICQSGHLDMQSVDAVLGADNQAAIKQLLSLVLEKDASGLSRLLWQLRQENRQQKDFYQDLLAFLHQDLLINLGVLEGEIFTQAKIDQFLLKKLLAAGLEQEVPISFLKLELALLEIIDLAKNKTTSNNGGNGDSTLKKKLLIKTEPAITKEVANSNDSSLTNNASPTSNTAFCALGELWPKLLQLLAENNHSLAGILRSCQLEEVIDGTAKVLVFYGFHKEQLEQNKYQLLLSESCRSLLGQDLKFNFVLAQASGGEENLLEFAKNVLI